MHVGSGQFAELPWSKHIHRIDPFHIITVDIKRILSASATASGIVHQYIYGAVSLYSKLYKLCQILFVKNIATYSHGPAACSFNLLCRHFCLFKCTAAHNHRCAGCRKRHAYTLAYAVATAGDNCYLSGKIKKRFYFFFHKLYADMLYCLL